MLRVAIIQSAYIPWRGFFDLVDRCDRYVIYDRMQFVKRHWHNRNRVKSPRGAEWLTIPVVTKSRYEQPIDEVEVSDHSWAERHWQTLRGHYARAAGFEAAAGWLEPLYEAAGRESRLARINELFLRAIADRLGITTTILRDDALNATGSKTARLLEVCQQLGATHYLSGPAARSYLEEAAFTEAGIAVEWMSYAGYPAYPQRFGPFEPGVSIVDLLLNVPQVGRELWRAGTASELERAEPVAGDA